MGEEGGSRDFCFNKCYIFISIYQITFYFILFPVFLSLKKLHYDYSVTNKRLNLNNPEINLPIYYCKSPFFLHIPGENLYPKNLDLTNISFFCNSSCFSGSPPVFSSMHEFIILRSRSITLVSSVWEQKPNAQEKEGQVLPLCCFNCKHTVPISETHVDSSYNQ